MIFIILYIIIYFTFSLDAYIITIFISPFISWECYLFVMKQKNKIFPYKINKKKKEYPIHLNNIVLTISKNLRVW